RRLKDPAAWDATAHLTAKDVRAYGLALGDVGADARVKDGTLTLGNVQVKLEGTPVTGSASLALAAPYRFSGKVGLKGWDLASLERLAPDLRPPFRVAG